MTDRSDRSNLPASEEDRVHDDGGLYPAGEGLSETPIHPTYEAMAMRNDLARQLENVLAAARAWARADGTPEAQAIADVLAELYERVGAPTERGAEGS
jgi:hypothetical protein